MDYKIIDINSSLEIKTTGGSPNPDTILSTMTYTDDKSHTDNYYLVVSASLEYAGQVGQVVVMTSEVMTAVYDSNGYLNSLTKTAVPSIKDILDAIDEKATDWIADINNRALLHSYTESIREVADLYDYEKAINEDPELAEYKDKWASRYTQPVINEGPYDELFGLTSEIGGNENRSSSDVPPSDAK